MGLFKKAFKKAKGKSIARKASGKMGKGLFGKVASKAVRKLENQSGKGSMARKASGKLGGKGLVGKIRSKALRKLENQSGKARTPSSGGIFGSLRKLNKEKPASMKSTRSSMPARGRGMSGSNQRKVAMYKDGGDIVAGASQQRRAAQGAEVVKSGIKKFAMGGAGKSGIKKFAMGGAGKSGVRKFSMGGAGKSGIKKLGRGGKLKK